MDMLLCIKILHIGYLNRCFFNHHLGLTSESHPDYRNFNSAHTYWYTYIYIEYIYSSRNVWPVILSFQFIKLVTLPGDTRLTVWYLMTVTWRYLVITFWMHCIAFVISWFKHGVHLYSCTTCINHLRCIHIFVKKTFLIRYCSRGVI